MERQLGQVDRVARADDRVNRRVAGRYLDINPTTTGYYTIDFNRAYNPSCYFNPTYECPYPPPENRLPLPVRAGERVSTRGRSTQ